MYSFINAHQWGHGCINISHIKRMLLLVPNMIQTTQVNNPQTSVYPMCLLTDWGHKTEVGDLPYFIVAIRGNWQPVIGCWWQVKGRMEAIPGGRQQSGSSLAAGILILNGLHLGSVSTYWHVVIDMISKVIHIQLPTWNVGNKNRSIV